MKKKKLALLLAVAMTVTSIDSTAMMVNAADFTSEEVQEQSVELTDEPSEATEETLLYTTFRCFFHLVPEYFRL